MLYKILGMFVWKGGKVFLRRKYGPTYAPAPVVAGSLAVALIGVLALAKSRDD